MADVTGGVPPTNASAFAVPAHIEAVYDHFGAPGYFSVATPGALPAVGNWAGRILSVASPDSLYKWDGSGWVLIYRAPTIGTAYNTAATNIPTGVATMVTLSSSSVTGSVTYASSRFTVTTAGRYRITASGRWQTSGTGYRRLAVDVNDVAITPNPQFVSAAGVSGTELGQCIVIPDITLAASDTVRMNALHDVGSTIEFRGPSLSIERIA